MKHTFTKSILFTLLISFCMQAHAQEMREYKTDTYQLQYPDGWQLDTSKKMGADLFVFSPMQGEKDQFRDNVNVMIQDAGQEVLSLEKYKKLTDDQLKTMVNDGRVYESDVVTVGNQRFYRVNYEMTQGIFRLRIFSKCFVRGSKAYLITFTMEASQFDHYKAIATQIVDSFQIQ